MKKYETPIAEKLEFNYADVVTASDTSVYTFTQVTNCEGSPAVNPSGKTNNKPDGCIWMDKPTNKKNC